MQKAKRHAFERELDEMIEADPKLKEFMELMAPRSKQKIWDNQDAAAFGGDAGTGAQGDARGVPRGVPGTNDRRSWTTGATTTSTKISTTRRAKPGGERDEEEETDGGRLGGRLSPTSTTRER